MKQKFFVLDPIEQRLNKIIEDGWHVINFVYANKRGKDFIIILAEKSECAAQENAEGECDDDDLTGIIANMMEERS